MSSNRLLKIISASLILVMLFQDLSWASSEIKSLLEQNAPTFKIPESFGIVEEKFKSAAPSKTLYLIQDAHTNESAQRNIAKILESILREKKIRTVYLEAGTGDDSLSGLRPLAPLSKRLAVSDIYLKKAWIQGPDYLDLISSHEFKLWGVEDKKLYFGGIDLYRKIVKKREIANSYLAKLRRTIDFLKTKHFSPLLLEFDGRREAFLKNELSLSEYFGVLSEESQKEGVSLFNYPNLMELGAVRAKEAAVDFKKADEEQKLIFRSLSAEDKRAFIRASRSGPMAKAGADNARVLCDFYAALAEKIPDNSRFHAFRRYLDYLNSARKIDAGGLLEEIKQLEINLYAVKTKTEEEGGLLRISNAEKVLSRVINLKALPSDLEDIQGDPGRFSAAEIGGQLNQFIMDLGTRYEETVFLNDDYEEVFRAAYEFYLLTERRDEVFIRNILTRMGAENEGEAAFVVGGFHIDNLKSLLRERGISYISIIPAVTQETNGKKYERLLLGQTPRTAGPAPIMAVNTSAKMWNTLPTWEQTINGRPVIQMLKSDLVPAGARLAEDEKFSEERPDRKKGNTVIHLTYTRLAKYLALMIAAPIILGIAGALAWNDWSSSKAPSSKAPARNAGGPSKSSSEIPKDQEAIFEDLPIPGGTAGFFTDDFNYSVFLDRTYKTTSQSELVLYLPKELAGRSVSASLAMNSKSNNKVTAAIASSTQVIKTDGPTELNFTVDAGKEFNFLLLEFEGLGSQRVNKVISKKLIGKGSMFLRLDRGPFGLWSETDRSRVEALFSEWESFEEEKEKYRGEALRERHFQLTQALYSFLPHEKQTGLESKPRTEASFEKLYKAAQGHLASLGVSINLNGQTLLMEWESPGKEFWGLHHTLDKGGIFTVGRDQAGKEIRTPWKNDPTGARLADQHKFYFGLGGSTARSFYTDAQGEMNYLVLDEDDNGAVLDEDKFLRSQDTVKFYPIEPKLGGDKLVELILKQMEMYMPERGDKPMNIAVAAGTPGWVSDQGKIALAYAYGLRDFDFKKELRQKVLERYRVTPEIVLLNDMQVAVLAEEKFRAERGYPSKPFIYLNLGTGYSGIPSTMHSALELGGLLTPTGILEEEYQKAVKNRDWHEVAVIVTNQMDVLSRLTGIYHFVLGGGTAFHFKEKIDIEISKILGRRDPGSKLIGHSFSLVPESQRDLIGIRNYELEESHINGIVITDPALQSIYKEIMYLERRILNDGSIDETTAQKIKSHFSVVQEKWNAWIDSSNEPPDFKGLDRIYAGILIWRFYRIAEKTDALWDHKNLGVMDASDEVRKSARRVFHRFALNLLKDEQLDQLVPGAPDINVRAMIDKFSSFDIQFSNLSGSLEKIEGQVGDEITLQVRIPKYYWDPKTTNYRTQPWIPQVRTNLYGEDRQDISFGEAMEDGDFFKFEKTLKAKIPGEFYYTAFVDFGREEGVQKRIWFNEFQDNPKWLIRPDAGARLAESHFSGYGIEFEVNGTGGLRSRTTTAAGDAVELTVKIPESLRSRVVSVRAWTDLPNDSDDPSWPLFHLVESDETGDMYKLELKTVNTGGYSVMPYVTVRTDQGGEETIWGGTEQDNAHVRTLPRWATEGMNTMIVFIRNLRRPGTSFDRSGNFTDFRWYLKELKKMGFTSVMLLPFTDPFEKSPYESYSAFSIDPNYIDWTKVPGLGDLQGLSAAEKLEWYKNNASKFNDIRSSLEFKEFLNNQHLWHYADAKAVHYLRADGKTDLPPEAVRLEARGQPDYEMLVGKEGQPGLYLFEQFIAFQQLSSELIYAKEELGLRVIFDQPFFQSTRGAFAMHHEDLILKDEDGRALEVVYDKNPSEEPQFWKGQARVNHDRLREEGYRPILRIFDYWLNAGFSGFRLDAAHMTSLDFHRAMNDGILKKRSDILGIAEQAGGSQEEADSLEQNGFLLYHMTDYVVRGGIQGLLHDIRKNAKDYHLRLNTTHDTARLLSVFAPIIGDSRSAAEAKQKALAVIALFAFSQENLTLQQGDEVGQTDRINIPGYQEEDWKTGSPADLESARYDIEDEIRSMIELRQKHSALRVPGNFTLLSEPNDPTIVFTRGSGDKTVLVSINLSPAEQEVSAGLTESFNLPPWGYRVLSAVQMDKGARLSGARKEAGFFLRVILFLEHLLLAPHVEIRGRENIIGLKRDESMLIASNHIQRGVDAVVITPMVYAELGRLPRFLFEVKFLGPEILWLTWLTKGIPYVNFKSEGSKSSRKPKDSWARSLTLKLTGYSRILTQTGRNSKKELIRKLEAPGQTIALFPAGVARNNLRKNVRDFKPSIVEISRESGTPILPLMIEMDGLDFQLTLSQFLKKVLNGLPNRGSSSDRFIRIAFGAPIYPGDFGTQEENLLALQQAMFGLIDTHAKGRYTEGKRGLSEGARLADKEIAKRMGWSILILAAAGLTAYSFGVFRLRESFIEKIIANVFIFTVFTGLTDYLVQWALHGRVNWNIIKKALWPTGPFLGVVTAAGFYLIDLIAPKDMVIDWFKDMPRTNQFVVTNIRIIGSFLVVKIRTMIYAGSNGGEQSQEKQKESFWISRPPSYGKYFVIQAPGFQFDPAGVDGLINQFFQLFYSWSVYKHGFMVKDGWWRSSRSFLMAYFFIGPIIGVVRMFGLLRYALPWETYSLGELGLERVPGDEGRIRYREGYAPPVLKFGLIVVPHGLTPANEGGEIFMNHVNDPFWNGLSAEGEKQAQDGAAVLFKEIGPEIIKNPDNYIILTTPLDRTEQTAKPFLELLRSAGTNVHKEVFPSAIETNFGKWDGHQDIKYMDQPLRELAERYRTGDAFVHAQDGESFVMLLDRVKQVIDELNAKYPGKTVILYGHGTFTQALKILMRLPDVDALGTDYIRWNEIPKERGYPLYFDQYSKTGARLSQSKVSAESRYLMTFIQVSEDLERLKLAEDANSLPLNKERYELLLKLHKEREALFTAWRNSPAAYFDFMVRKGYIFRGERGLAEIRMLNAFAGKHFKESMHVSPLMRIGIAIGAAGFALAVSWFFEDVWRFIARGLPGDKGESNPPVSGSVKTAAHDLHSGRLVGADGAEKAFVYFPPSDPEAFKDADKSLKSFEEMIFGFPKMLQEAVTRRLPVVLVVEEDLEGRGPLEEEAPRIEGQRVMLAWASAYFRFRELGNADVRVLRVPKEKFEDPASIEAAVRHLASMPLPEPGPSESQNENAALMEGRLFLYKDIPEYQSEEIEDTKILPYTAAGTKSFIAPRVIAHNLPALKAGQKRVLVTGGAGFVGHHLVEKLLLEGTQVIVLDNFSSGLPENIEPFKDNTNFYFEKWDASKPFVVSGRLHEVYHLASLASPVFYYKMPSETMTAGLEATKNTAELARRHNAKFVFASTSEVYGDPDPSLAAQEESYPGRVNPIGRRSQYDESKRGAETLLKLLFEKYGSDIRLVRIFNTYGPFMRPDDGRVVSNFIVQVLNNEPITLYGDGSQTRSFGYVEDTVNGMVALMRSPLVKRMGFMKNRVYNIGNPGEFTIRELAESVNLLAQKHLGYQVPITYLEQHDKDDPKQRKPDINRAASIFGYKPEIQLDEGLEKTFLHFKNIHDKKKNGARLSGLTPDLAQNISASHIQMDQKNYLPWLFEDPKDHLIEISVEKGIGILGEFNGFSPRAAALVLHAAFLKTNDEHPAYVLAVTELATSPKNPLRTWALLDDEGRFIQLKQDKISTLPSQFMGESDYDKLADYTYQWSLLKESPTIHAESTKTVGSVGHEWIDYPVIGARLSGWSLEEIKRMSLLQDSESILEEFEMELEEYVEDHDAYDPIRGMQLRNLVLSYDPWTDALFEVVMRLDDEHRISDLPMDVRDRIMEKLKEDISILEGPIYSTEDYPEQLDISKKETDDLLKQLADRIKANDFKELAAIISEYSLEDILAAKAQREQRQLNLGEPRFDDFTIKLSIENARLVLNIIERVWLTKSGIARPDKDREALINYIRGAFPTGGRLAENISTSKIARDSSRSSPIAYLAPKIAAFFVGVALAFPAVSEAQIPIKTVPDAPSAVSQFSRRGDEVVVSVPGSETLRLNISNKTIAERQEQQYSQGAKLSQQEWLLEFDSKTGEISGLLDQVKSETDERLILEIDRGLVTSASSAHERSMIAELKKLKDHADAKNVLFVAYGAVPIKGEDAVFSKEIPPDFANAKRVRVGLPENLNNAYAKIPAQALGPNDLTSFELVGRLAIKAGRIAPNNIPDTFLSAYAAFVGHSVMAGDLGPVWSGQETDPDRLLIITLKPILQNVVQGARLADMRRRMVEQAA